jgi:hypothetical protein
LADGLSLFHYLGERDRRGLERLRRLLSRGEPLLAIPLQPNPPTDLAELEALGRVIIAQLER